MTAAAPSPRDRLQRMVDLGRRALRYWWLVAACGALGGALALTFVMVRARTYQSHATLFYHERIQSQLLSPNREEIAQRNIGDKYRELLLAREQLEHVVRDAAINPFPDEDLDVAIDKLRQAVKLEVRGGNAFRIVYADVDPERARAVTARLTTLLQHKDEQLRNEQARNTVEFITKHKEEAATELRKQEQALAEFLAKHPEFAQDPNQHNEGASIRAIRNQKPIATGNTKLYALERQRRRIQARLEAPPDAPPIRTVVPPSPARLAAEGVVTEAQRELNAATRELDDAQARYTPRHPSVIKAQDRVALAQQRLRAAQAALPPKIEETVAPATPQDRAKLQRELGALEAQILALQRAGGGAGAGAAADPSTDWVVQLETQHNNLRRAVAEQRDSVESLAASVFRSQIDASQKLAEQGGRLAIIDPAFRPVRPTGPGKTIFLLAGVALFVALGGAVAFGLAVIDDRLYRRADLDQLGIAVLAVVPPAPPPARMRGARA